MSIRSATLRHNCSKFAIFDPSKSRIYTQNFRNSRITSIKTIRNSLQPQLPYFRSNQRPQITTTISGRKFLCVARSGEVGDGEIHDDTEERQLLNALLLAFLASQNRSLFAAKCLIESAIALYRRGYNLDDIKVSLMLATLSTSDPLKPIMLDVLLTWTSVVMMTCKTVGVPLLPDHASKKKLNMTTETPTNEHEDRMTQGLEFFVKSCVDRFLSGTDLFRLQLQQSMQSPLQTDDPDAQGESPTVAVLQQNTRLAIITLEVVRDMRLPTTIDLSSPTLSQETRVDITLSPASEEEEEPQQSNQDTVENKNKNRQFYNIEYIDGFLTDNNQKSSQLRSAAIRLLIAFNGAVLGYLRSAQFFVSEAFNCYTYGWTAEEIFSSLQGEEFAQSGGVTRFNLANAPGGRHISAALFARWLALSYMALVLLGVSHPGSLEKKDGWAWVDSLNGSSSEVGGALEAYGMAEFVQSTLRNAVLSDEESGGDEEAREAGGRRGARIEAQAVHDETVDGFGTAFEDPTLLKTSSFALLLSQEISLIRLTRLVVLSKMRQQSDNFAQASSSSP